MLINDRSKLSNHLLATLSDLDWLKWKSNLQLVELQMGEVLYESGVPMEHLFFPTTAIVSLLHILNDGDCTQIALVGRDGLIGVSVFMGDGSTSSRAEVQQGGMCYRINAKFVLTEFDTSVYIMKLMLKYTQTLITQMSQLAVCNRHHTIEQQFCRWLLLTLDQLESDTLLVTQEQISHHLGVRREGVTRAAGLLQKAGYINYSRGHLTCKEREGIHSHSCECYDVIKKEYDRLLPKIHHHEIHF